MGHLQAGTFEDVRICFHVKPVEVVGHFTLLPQLDPKESLSTTGRVHVIIVSLVFSFFGERCTQTVDRLRFKRGQL